MATDRLTWEAAWTIDTYSAETGLLISHSVIESNMLMYAGASNLWEYALGNGTATTDMALTYLNNAEAHIGIGDGTLIASPTQTALAGINTFLSPMDLTYPLHAPGATSANTSTAFLTTVGTADANFAWEEFALFNGAGGSKTMINRKVSPQGTKTVAETRVLSLTLGLA